MQKLQIDTYQHYLQHLQTHSDEHLALLDDALINFTEFFRDRNAWISLVTEIIPNIITNQRSRKFIRVWSAGCANGSEIYSLLILFAEVLGVEACLQRVRCYATDADANTLQQAERAIYSPLEITGIPPQLLEKYFEQTQQGYVFHPQLRNLVTFKHHNLIKDAPLSGIDLLMCRNVLMYFTPSAQEIILSRFYRSLRSTGVLFLGQAELVMNDRLLFSPINLKQKIYAKEPELKDNSPISSKASWQQIAHQLQDQDPFWQTIFESRPCDPLADLLTKLAAEIKNAALE